MLRIKHTSSFLETLKSSRGKSWFRFSFLPHLILLSLASVGLSEEVASDPNDEAISFFEREVRPVLLARCGGCHGAKKQEGGLRVDSRANLLRGGHTAPAILAEDLEQSLLLRAIRREGDLEMPPDEELPANEIRALRHWVLSGAIWPAGNVEAEATSKGKVADHWAFQPVREPGLPAPRLTDWIRNPVDLFVAEKLSLQGLAPSPSAARQTLIRRITYGLTGLPPTHDEVARFVNDTDPHAYDKLVTRLLASPQYAEQWARHWLDVARYSDTKGYVYAREERNWTHAWTYRDWVVRALNEDMAYDRFLLLQIAADQVADSRPSDLAAMGFLTLGRRFLGVRRDVIDDRIDVVCRGTMALTVSCARCHDHKYDPIPTADYYSLYGVFDSCIEEQRVLVDSPGNQPFRDEFSERRAALRSKLITAKEESSERVRQRVADYLFAQTELERFPANGFDQIFEKSDLLPAFVRRWARYLRVTTTETLPLTPSDPNNSRRSVASGSADESVFGIWRACLQVEDSAVERAVVTSLSTQNDLNPLIADAFSTPPHSFRQVCDLYGHLFSQVNAQWLSALAAADSAQRPRPSALGDPHAESLRQVLYGPTAPCCVPDGPISYTETFFDSATCTELWKLQGEVDRFLIKTPSSIPVALALIDQASPIEPRIFQRGDPLKLGADVPRRFLGVLSDSGRKPFRTGSGRRELASSIVDPGNPLTARVLVNRVWAHHFGKGLVSTPSDFGLRADFPSHPELLDWLAARFMESGWSLKQLHRWIVLSATYRQASAPPQDPNLRARLFRVDPDNRLLWRASPQRLTFEEIRDSLFHATGELDRQIGGKPKDLFSEPFLTRRTLYGQVDRQYFPSVLRMFDFANPDLHVPQRIETTVPQQALFFMNHPLVLERARILADQARVGVEPRAAIFELFRRTLQRDPGHDELSDALALVESAGFESPGSAEEEGGTEASNPPNDAPAKRVPVLDPWARLAQVLFCTNEFLFVD